MPATITDTGNISNPVNYVLNRKFLDRARQVAIYVQGTMPGELPTHEGSRTTKWRRYENQSPSTTALSEQTSTVAIGNRSSQVPSITDVTATVAFYGNHYIINHEVDLTNPVGQDFQLADVLAIQAGRSLNRLVRDEMEDNATQIRAGGATANSAITSRMTGLTVANLFNTLQRNSAMLFFPMTRGDTAYNTSPIRPAFLGFCHVDVEYDIRNLAGFVDVSSYAGQTRTYRNEFGTVGGVRWLSTEEASVATDSGGAAGDNRSTTGTSADLYEAIVMGQNAVGTTTFDNPTAPSEAFTSGDDVATIRLFSHPKGSAGSIVDPHGEFHVMGYDFWHVSKIVNANWIRRGTSCATKLNA